MHRKLGIGVLLACLSFSAIHAQVTFEPEEYYYAISDEMAEIDDRHVEYVSGFVYNLIPEQITERRIAMIDQIKLALERINYWEPCENCENLRNATMDMLFQYMEAFNVDFREADEYRANSESSYEAKEQYFESLAKAEKKLDESYAAFEVAKRIFVKFHDFEPVEMEGDDMAKRVIEVGRYERGIYRLYFKAAKTKADFFDAWKSGNYAVLEPLRRDLLADASEGLAKIKSIQTIPGGQEYKDRAFRLLNYYQSLAANEFADLVKIMNPNEAYVAESGNAETLSKIINSYKNDYPRLLSSYQAAQEQILHKNIPRP